ncbi:MAG: tRNA nucleotidyl transferase, partial [Desulfosarcina sp.]
MTQIITTHGNTDFDAFACLAAAQVIYPDARVAIPSAVNPNVRAFISIHKDMFDTVERQRIDPDAIRRLIVVDTADWRRLGHLSTLKHRSDVEVMLWDHHNAGDIVAAWKCQEAVGATITLFVR